MTFLSDHGLSEQLARIMIAEIGRKDSFNSNLFLGSHTVPKNGVMNVRLIS
ncbi:hypothetical protein SASC598O02_007590 [Snodgrassella alvi SCGC AB-598-O02]|nr:hypothetical protein SASC598O02_007590 [Snodgrassella alvi SCGC AB-598-O02]